MDKTRSTVIEQMQDLLPVEGVFASEMKGIELVRSNQVTERRGLIYQPVFYIVIQGSKQSYLGGESYYYDPFNFLALSVPLPMEGHVVEATPELPYLALKIHIKPEYVREVMVRIPPVERTASIDRGVCISPLTDRMVSAVSRLVDALTDKDRARVLAPMVVKELLFYALLGPQGAQLAAFVTAGRYHERIAQVIRFIQVHYAESFDISTLANIANMSPSALHQHFKNVTNVSPLQYIKQIRLLQAKEMVVHQQNSISETAYRVGYQSLSQFSREYKRMFGVSPSQAV